MFQEGKRAKINNCGHFGRIKVFPRVLITKVDGGYIFARVYQRNGSPFTAEFLENELTPI